MGPVVVAMRAAPPGGTYSYGTGVGREDSTVAHTTVGGASAVGCLWLGIWRVEPTRERKHRCKDTLALLVRNNRHDDKTSLCTPYMWASGVPRPPPTSPKPCGTAPT